MNRTDVVRAVANSERMPQAAVERVVESVMDVIALALACGEEVNLRSFGKFEPRTRRAVVRRNPQTGVDISVPAKSTVGFVPSKTLKARLNRRSEADG